MDNIPASENVLVQEEKISKKFPLLRILLVLIFLIILGVLAFVFKDNISGLFFSKDAEPTLSSQVESTQESLFGSFVGNEKDIDVSSLIKEYQMGSGGSTARVSFQGVEENTIDIGHGKYPLASDFLVLCAEKMVDVRGQSVENSDTRFPLGDGQRLKDEVLKALEIPIENRKSLLEKYSVGEWIHVSFPNDGSFLEIKKVILFFNNPEVCYE